VIPIGQLLDTLRGTLDEWQRLRWSDLHYTAGHTALLVFAVLVATAVLLALARGLGSRPGRRRRLALPALLPAMRRSRFAIIRHGASFVFVAGIPFFAIALADPHTSLRRDDVSYPGRRIALVVDASTSMVTKFDTVTLKTQGAPTFYTAVAAAERFMRQRMAGPYRDLVALIQFGNEAYVVTPFTTDYENILLSLKLIGTPIEWGRFSDWGTTIIQGLGQGAALFEAFDFLNASGNLMLIFTDGRDDQRTLKGQDIDRLVQSARTNKVPMYMIRTARNMKLGDITQDGVWKPAMERTGGRFYAAPDEASILRALDEIDRLSAGVIERREYTTERPRFSGYALIAVGLWLAAGTLKFSVPYFNTFP
jgi:hypothetical protein